MRIEDAILPEGTMTTGRPYRLTIIIPAYNEAATVAGTISDYRKIFPAARLVVIDNNSADGTGAIAAVALDDGRDVLLTERRQGKGAAVKAGLSRLPSDIYILVDADGTYPAAEAARLLRHMEATRCDMVVGDRITGGAYARQNTRAGHDLGNRLLTRFISRLAGQPFTDVLSGLRIMSRPFVNMLDIRSSGFELETELNIIAAYLRASIVELPIEYRERPEGSASKLNTVRDGLRISWFMVLNWIAFFPLQSFGLLAGIAFAVSLGLGLKVFLAFLNLGIMPYPSTAVAAAAAGIIGLLAVFTGVMLRILLRAQRRRDAAAFLDMRREWNARIDGA